MQGSGTDTDITWHREISTRLEKNENEVHEIKIGQSRLAASIDKQDARIELMLEGLRDLGSKLDETRNRKTPVWAAAAALVAILSGGIAVQTFIFEPYVIQVMSLSERMRVVEANRYTEGDAVTDMRRLEEEIDAEVADTRENLNRIRDRILHLERNKADK
jgi:hypothetical protein